MTTLSPAAYRKYDQIDDRPQETHERWSEESAHWVGNNRKAAVQGSFGDTMKTVEIVETSNGQAVPLPDEFRFDTPMVFIRRDGDAVILEPIKRACWPERFFDDIRI